MPKTSKKENENPVEKKGAMTVKEAGHKGGSTTKARYGEEYYHNIGRKGGAKVRELIARGKESMKK